MPTVFQHYKMNDYVGPDSFPIVPSVDLPCSRLPFGVHRSICSALDPHDRWKDLAADGTLDLESEKVRWLHNRHKSNGQSCTSALLELLWKDKQTNAGEMLSALKRMNFSTGDLVTHLGRYLQGLVTEEESAQTSAAGRLIDDPRQPVSGKHYSVV